MMKLDQKLKQNMFNWLLKKFGEHITINSALGQPNKLFPEKINFSPQTMRKITLDLTLNIVVNIFKEAFL